MADILVGVLNNVKKLFKDMGDGSVAEVTASKLLDAGNNVVNLGPPVCLGEYSLTVDTSGTDNALSTLLGGTVLADAIAAGLSFITATVETSDLRASFFNNDPSSTGQLYAKGNSSPYVWNPSDFTKVKLAGQGANATVRVGLWK